jgi:hypothetical protein
MEYCLEAPYDTDSGGYCFSFLTTLQFDSSLAVDKNDDER